MNTFPFLTPLEGSIINKMSSVNKANFSGAAPFVIFQHYIGTGITNDNTIGTNASYAYSNKGILDRFPPVITNLEIKPTGSMGVIREASVTVKFSSMLQLKRYQNFFRVGNAKCVSWGWTKKRDGGLTDSNPISCASATLYADNINSWQFFCNANANSRDVLVGPLMDFAISVNNDATVDVVFKIGSKNEIPAFLGNTTKDANSTATNTGQEKLDGKISSLFNLTEADFTKLKSKYDVFRDHFINYGYANRGAIDQGASVLAESVGMSYDSTSESIYIDMDWIVRFAINKNCGGKNPHIVNIDRSIGCAHANMLSNSENIIFPNEKAANPVRGSKGELTLDITNTQNIKQKAKGQTYVQQSVGNWTIDGHKMTFPAGKWGYVKNIFVKQEFVEELFKTHANGNTKDILADLCAEINRASCGLTEFAPQVAPALGKNTMTYTIVDYALVPPTLPSYEKLKLFDKDSTITNISFSSDLPKEIAAMAMLKDRDQKNREIGQNLFFASVVDGCNVLEANLSNVKEPIVGDPKGIPATEQGLIDKALDTATKAWDGLKNLFSAASNAYQSLTGISGVVDDNCTIVSFKHNEYEFNTPPAGSTLVNGFKVAVKDTQLLKNLYFGPGNTTNKNNPLLPVELEITTLGLSGVTVGKVCKVDNLPFQDPNGLLQVIEVNHTVDSSQWQTNIKFRYRPGN